jgi:hypothetical protein
MPGKGDINPATGKAYAVNPATGNWDDNYWANTVEPQLRAKYGSTSSGGGGGSVADPIETARKLLEFNRQANQPVVQSLQSQIPEKEAAYQTLQGGYDKAISTSNARYDQLLKDVTSLSTQNVTESFGKRNIPVSSGIYGQEVADAVEPQTERIGIEREATVSGLEQNKALVGMEGISAVSAIEQAIAQLQAGDASGAVNSALAYIQQKQTADYNNKLLALKEAEANKPTADQYISVGENSSLFNPATGQWVTNPGIAAQVGSNTPSKVKLQDFSDDQQSVAPKKYAVASLGNGLVLYSDGSTGYGMSYGG